MQVYASIEERDVPKDNGLAGPEEIWFYCFLIMIEFFLIFVAEVIRHAQARNYRGRDCWTYRDMREKGADFLRIIRFLSRSFLCQHMASGEVMRKALRRSDGDTFLHVLCVFLVTDTFVF
jgi:hypothetical protein